MSYDTSIIIDTGGEYPAEVEEVGNYTSNVSLMYHLVLPGPYQGGGKYNGYGESEPRGGLPGLSGLPCPEAAEILEKAIADMITRREEMTSLNPPNGWGNYESALKYLQRIYWACLKHPKATLAVNW